jgi:CheY-like chemotaxis protein
MRILLVDDDFFFTKAMGFLFAEAGHEVVYSQDGQKAYDILKNDRKIDLILCDLDMPVLSGPEFIAAVKLLYLKNRPLIGVVSGLKKGPDLLRQSGTEYDYYFEKPLNVNAFEKTLLQIAKRVTESSR